jgi:hypothetical protein
MEADVNRDLKESGQIPVTSKVRKIRWLSREPFHTLSIAVWLRVLLWEALGFEVLFFFGG